MNMGAEFIAKTIKRLRVVLQLDMLATWLLRKKCKLDGWGSVYVYPKNKIKVSKEASTHVVNGVLTFSKPWFEVNETGPCVFEMEKKSKMECYGDFDFIRGGECIVKEGAILRLGSGGRIGKGSELRCNGEISIGSRCWISDNVTISDTGKIIIEDNVWIGNDVRIEGCIKIGKNAVIGHGLTVSGDVAENAVLY